MNTGNSNKNMISWSLFAWEIYTKSLDGILDDLCILLDLNFSLCYTKGWFIQFHLIIHMNKQNINFNQSSST